MGSRDELENSAQGRVFNEEQQNLRQELRQANGGSRNRSNLELLAPSDQPQYEFLADLEPAGELTRADIQALRGMQPIPTLEDLLFSGPNDRPKYAKHL